MGVGRAMVDASCDVCGLESEPIELMLGARGYSLEDAAKELRNDGWKVDDRTLHLTCSDCVEDSPGATQ